MKSMARADQEALTAMIPMRQVDTAERCMGCGWPMEKGETAYCSEDERHVFCSRDCLNYPGRMEG